MADRVALPGKKPLMEMTARPANYETPLEYFREPVTPNDGFYIRSHGIPPTVAARDWRLEVGGDAAGKRVTVGLDDLRALPSAEITAVCYCAGNRRSLFPVPAPGLQWGDGGMGNAVWKGARLKDVLGLAAPGPDAIEVFLGGADEPASKEKFPFVKSLPLWKAMEDNTLIAYTMNGEPLPLHNGAPLRVVVPGWTATYWVKHLSSLALSTRPFEGHWMTTDYRVPRASFSLIERFETQETPESVPVTENMVNSLIVNATALEISGIAWDGGYGIKSVELSFDAGKTWAPADLGDDLGRFAYRTWRFTRSGQGGAISVLARATNRRGQTQPLEAVPNALGYYHNAVQRLTLTA